MPDLPSHVECYLLIDSCINGVVWCGVVGWGGVGWVGLGCVHNACSMT